MGQPQRLNSYLLSAAGHSAVQIAELTFFEQDGVLFWLNRYEADGLEDRPCAGRTPKSGRRLRASPG